MVFNFKHQMSLSIDRLQLKHNALILTKLGWCLLADIAAKYHMTTTQISRQLTHPCIHTQGAAINNLVHIYKQFCEFDW